ncbi:hypothetical protein R83H12_00757 [Fibrobacteria bacterium R8-3-H12]
MHPTKEFLEKSVPAENVLVLFDENQEPGKVIKRIAIILDTQNKGLIIDNLAEIGVIDVANRQDGYGNIMWYPTQEIGLLRKLSVEKLIENNVVADQVAKNAITKICQAEKDKSKTAITVLEVFTIAKNYIERYPVTNGGA